MRHPSRNHRNSSRAQAVALVPYDQLSMARENVIDLIVTLMIVGRPPANLYDMNIGHPPGPACHHPLNDPIRAVYWRRFIKVANERFPGLH